MKSKHSLILLLLLLGVVAGKGQPAYQVRGVVTDTAGTPLTGATIRIFLRRDTLTTLSQPDGKYVLQEVTYPSFGIVVSLVGYQPVTRRVVAGNQRMVTLDTFRLQRFYHSLDTAIVTAVAPIVLKGDTIEYRAAAYKTQEGDLVEDLVRKLPGIVVDRDGGISAQGKKIVKVTVNGRDFFGDDILTATRNLPSDIVKNIQVVQDYGEESKLTGIKTGRPVAVLNINTKEDKSAGRLGEATVGKGTDGRYQGSVFANQFGREQRLALTAAANNINTGAGVSDQQSFGINYGDRWSDKLSGNGSYRYGHQVSTQSGSSVQQSSYSGGNTVNTSENNSMNRTASHNLNYTFLYNPDKLTTVSVNTRMLYSGSSSVIGNDFTIDQMDSSGKRITTGQSRTGGEGRATGVGASGLLVHRFGKQDRVISLNVSLDRSWSKQNGDNLNQARVSVNDSAGAYTPLHQQVSNDNGTGNMQLKLTYMEPVGKQRRFLLNYVFTGYKLDAQRNTYTVDSGAIRLVDSLSNGYSYSLHTQQAGMGLHGSNKHWEYELGLSVQQIVLNSGSGPKDPAVSYKAIEMIPALNFLYSLSKALSICLNYGVTTAAPSLLQLRPVTDLSNPQYPVTGNPYLKPSYTHNVNLSMNKVSVRSGDMLTVNFNLTATRNSTVSNVTDGPFAVAPGAVAVIQETRYLNANGVYVLDGAYSYSKALLHHKLMVGWEGGIGYSNNVSFMDNVRAVNVNRIWSQGIQIGVNLPGTMDALLHVNYSSNKTDYHMASVANTTINTLMLVLSGRNYFWHHYMVGYTMRHVLNSGYSNVVASNPTFIDMSIERWFGKNKKFAIRLRCFNLLNQGLPAMRSVVGNTITDSRTNQVGRYFILTGSIRLSKFSGRSK